MVTYMALVLSSAALLAVLALLVGPALAEEGEFSPSVAAALPQRWSVPSGATQRPSAAIWSPSGPSWPSPRMQMALSSPSFCLSG